MFRKGPWEKREKKEKGTADLRGQNPFRGMGGDDRIHGVVLKYESLLVPLAPSDPHEMPARSEVKESAVSLGRRLAKP